MSEFPPHHAAPFLVLVPNAVPTNSPMWPSATCPDTAAALGCGARPEGGDLPPPHRRSCRHFRSPSRLRRSRGPRRPSCGGSARWTGPCCRLATAAEREGAWHGAEERPGWAGGEGAAAGQSCCCGGGSLRVGGVESPGGSVRRRFLGVSVEPWAARAAGVRAGVFQLLPCVHSPPAGFPGKGSAGPRAQLSDFPPPRWKPQLVHPNLKANGQSQRYSYRAAHPDREGKYNWAMRYDFCSSELASRLHPCVWPSAGGARPCTVSLEAEGRGKITSQVVTSPQETRLHSFLYSQNDFISS